MGVDKITPKETKSSSPDTLEKLISQFLPPEFPDITQLEQIQVTTDLKDKTILGKDSLGNHILAGDLFFDVTTKLLVKVSAATIHTLSQGIVINSNLELVKAVRKQLKQKKDTELVTYLDVAGWQSDQAA